MDRPRTLDEARTFLIERIQTRRNPFEFTDQQAAREAVDALAGLDGARWAAWECVYVPEAVQLQRLVSERGLDEKRARAIIGSQMPIEEKRRLADHVIDNSGSQDATREQVKNFWREKHL